jgi:probable F420-dependent oxidoreductase
VKLDARLTVPLADAGPAARGYEAAGYAGAWIAETKYDPFLPLVPAAQATSTIQVGTSIAVAFARSPMTVATTANDLQRLSQGRFVLGLGTQVKGHVERRFSMPWSSPAARIREYITALHAIWDAWNNETRLDFRGEFYRHDLMTPFFQPEPNPYGAPKVLLAGVGPMLTEVAGAVADGFVCHAFTTERYLREVTVPLLAKARADAGKDMSDFEICGPSFVVTGLTDEQFAAAREGVKGQIAFYAATPAYRPVLEMHGWGDLQAELNNLARADRWPEMSALISDEILDAFAIVAPPEGIADALRARFADIITRISLYLPYDRDPSSWEPVVRRIGQL